MAFRLIVLLTGLLVAGLAQAIDEDYYIPYTDTYGYVYDPDTGKFVKEEPKPAPGQGSAAGDSTKAGTGDHAAQAAPSAESRESLESEGGTAPFIWISGGGILLIAGFLYWFRQKRRSAVLD
jgi:hypothetical protein